MKAYHANLSYDSMEHTPTPCSAAWARQIETHGSVAAARKNAAEYQRTRRASRGRSPRSIAEIERDNHKCGGKGRLKSNLCIEARNRGKGKRGNLSVGGDIRPADLYWPEFCPVLGIKLDYDTPIGQRTHNNPCAPSLDRWDNSKGYIKENVFVISLRANQIKGNATPDELRRVALYASLPEVEL